MIIAWRNSHRGRVLLLVCLGCFAVAQGLDFLEGIDDLFEDLAADLGRADYTISHGFRAAEEVLEMLGTTAFWAPVLWTLADNVGGTSLEFEQRRRRP